MKKTVLGLLVLMLSCKADVSTSRMRVARMRVAESIEIDDGRRMYVVEDTTYGPQYLVVCGSGNGGCGVTPMR